MLLLGTHYTETANVFSDYVVLFILLLASLMLLLPCFATTQHKY